MKHSGNYTSNNTANTPKSQEGAPFVSEIVSARELQLMDLPPVRFIVESILPQGLSILAAPAKYGKSWFVLDLCLSVAAGEPLLGFASEKCGTLYLALEDSLRRLKSRMNAILKGREAPWDFDYQIRAPTLDNGLIDMLEAYIATHPTLGLIVVDMLQKVRSQSRQHSTIYAAEYADMTLLKALADKHNIAILVLHHNRKMTDASDPFNMISGTMALMATADTSLVFTREQRKDEETSLHVTGRDVEMNTYVISWDKETYRQRLIGLANDISIENKEAEYRRDPVVVTILELLKLNPDGVQMSASDFIVAMAQHSCIRNTFTPVGLGKHILQLKPDLHHYNGVVHKLGRQRTHCFSYDIVADKENPFLTLL